MHMKMQTKFAKIISKIRSSTVEPVLGTLINFLNMKRVNTRGIKLANKHVLMATLTYNLKKYMKFIAKKVNIQNVRLSKNNLLNLFLSKITSLQEISPNLRHLFFLKIFSNGKFDMVK